jgi:phage tail-like protein
MSAAQPGAPVSAAYRVSGLVPALFHEDPLFLELCAAFDDLLSPVVTALDCFTAYLDPSLAPEDFLAWLGSLVGAEPDPVAGAGPGSAAGTGSGDGGSFRALIAGAVRSYHVRGTPDGLRDAVAAATGVPADQVRVTECGAVTWSQSPGLAEPPPFDPVVEISLPALPGQDPDAVAARARAAAAPSLPVFSQLRVTVVKK